MKEGSSSHKPGNLEFTKTEHPSKNTSLESDLGQ